MWILNAIKIHPLIFIILLIILLLSICFIIFLVKRERKLDNIEIEELTKELDDNNFDKIEEEEIDNKVFKNQVDLENLLMHMQEDLEAKPTDVITHFENDQEEKSIISYQELVESLKSEKQMFSNNKEIINQETSNIDSITSNEPIKTEIQTDLGEITKVEIPEVKEEKKFKGSEFISPIYGRQKSSTDYPKVPEFKHRTRLDEILMKEENSNKTMIEENLDLEPLREEIKRNDEFLQALKEFRKNL